MNIFFFLSIIFNLLPGYSIYAISPDYNQPSSVNVSLFFSSNLKYPGITFGPLTHNSPLGNGLPYSSLSLFVYPKSGQSTNLNSFITTGPPTCPE